MDVVLFHCTQWIPVPYATCFARAMLPGFKWVTHFYRSLHSGVKLHLVLIWHEKENRLIVHTGLCLLHAYNRASRWFTVLIIKNPSRAGENQRIGDAAASRGEGVGGAHGRGNGRHGAIARAKWSRLLGGLCMGTGFRALQGAAVRHQEL